MKNLKSSIKVIREKLVGLDTGSILRFFATEYPGRVSFASSFGEEDQVITDLIAKFAPGINVFTLDTGRLFPETYDLIDKTQKRYNLSFQIYFPEREALEKMVKNHGVNLFYKSVENRKLCCHIRKVEPLKRALKDVDVWLSGIRRDQSVTRSDADLIEWDEVNQKIKVNPLIDWSLDQVKEYITANNIDINPLHKKGFISIGCSPCTRAIRPGEDIRAGRWWWEQPDQKECGLHNNPKWAKNKGH